MGCAAITFCSDAFCGAKRSIGEQKAKVKRNKTSSRMGPSHLLEPSHKRFGSSVGEIAGEKGRCCQLLLSLFPLSTWGCDSLTDLRQSATYCHRRILSLAIDWQVN